mmetsp:Transcript_41147/g.86419  ORF Transcript_41147/g.86419 Transcript_41147/m.86419 type:complete len:972 (+) Transcript_41147:1-2916(+)|eukprot:CAMPEP_0183703660 /NCGR_PEP_ID=MMETSP0737-20130205/1328_1 /TAXON_ID=385413 /ORGANISM="Thalassiosira miniscula, Strain CCMP1093" /LENGTH=971 /DNA_ID=CAMNT_0025930457 /DNA_START=309 /DNA_END=3224 /DNA_ORIENTATION=-
MNAQPPSLNHYLPRDFMPRSLLDEMTGSSGGSRGEEKKDWLPASSSSSSPPFMKEQQRQDHEGSSSDLAGLMNNPIHPGEDYIIDSHNPISRQNSHDSQHPPPLSQQPLPKSILKSRVSSTSLHSQHNAQTQAQRQEEKEREIASILTTLEDLQHNFVTNDNSTGSSNNPQAAHQSATREFTVRNFPNGDLFSGNVDAETKELIYGRMTCALQMEVYEGPFWKGKRHGEGAMCAKMDGGAKFLGRYHEGQMHSGTLIVTRNLPSDFTYTGTFLNNDFHGIGTIVSQNGSIYQGQFAHGQYHGVGTLRSVCDDDEEYDQEDIGAEKKGGEGSKNKMESVYTGDFSEGLFHGSGTLTHSDGSSYVGTWSEGKRVEGIETLSNGDVFEGKFVNDVRTGQGVLKMKCGKITKCGVWEGDVLKAGVDLNITFADGHVYCGDHANSLPHGFGRMEYSDLGSGESAYTGWFINGVRHGQGRCFFHSTGQEYEGEWACDEPTALKIFQHDGPLVEEDCTSGEEEGDDVVETIECPPTSLTQLHNALSKETTTTATTSGKSSEQNPASSYHRKSSNELNSSLVSVSSSTYQSQETVAETVGDSIVGGGTVESIALSSITVPQSASHRGRSTNKEVVQPTSVASQRSVRCSVTDTENLSLSMKSLSVYENYNSEQGLKIYRYNNGDVFKGRLDRVTNLRQGSGTYTEHRMGSVYNGDWRDSKRHGVGHLKLASGVEYSGEFFEDRIHGQGSMTLIDGSVYTGSFFNGLFHGRGMLEDEERSHVYFGEFENGECSGEGDEKFPDGSRFKGEYKNSKRNGTGVYFNPNGSELYNGEWHEDLRHGKGKLHYHHREGEDGSLLWEGSYEGDFFRDKFSGNGKYTYTDGTSIEGQWLDDIPRDGDWSIKYPDGSKFYGFATFQHPDDSKLIQSDGSASPTREFLRVPLPHGFGSLTHANGHRFVGSFVYGQYNVELERNERAFMGT